MATNWNDFKNTVLADVEARRKAAFEMLPHDIILGGWESYISDMEMCLRFDGDDCEGWQDYLADPRPYITDLLCDFGDWDKLNLPKGIDHTEVARAAADNYWNPKPCGR